MCVYINYILLFCIVFILCITSELLEQVFKICIHIDAYNSTTITFSFKIFILQSDAHILIIDTNGFIRLILKKSKSAPYIIYTPWILFLIFLTFPPGI